MQMHIEMSMQMPQMQMHIEMSMHADATEADAM